MSSLRRLAIAAALGASLADGTLQVKHTIAATEAQAEERPIYRPTGLEGKLHGRILFDGDPPIPKRIDMSGDANCAAIAKRPLTEDFIVAEGGLSNAFVYVKG